MTCRVEGGVTYTHTYNAENRASSIAKRSGDCATGTILESWSFAYDGDGTRVTTAHFTGTSGTPDSTTSYFMGGQYEVKDSAVKKYYSIAGMMVAMNDGSGLQYILTDHLGSTVAVTNASGTLTSQQRYLPFGAARTIPNSPILGTDFTYTGQRKLDDGMGGIMDYKARFYSPALGRFLQSDSIIPDQSNPQSWNRFSYVLNNPVLYNDPSGHCAWDFCIAEGITAYALGQALVNALTLVVAAVFLLSPPVVNTREDDWRGMPPPKELDSIESMQANYNKSFDDGLMPGEGYTPPACGFFCKFLIGIGLSGVACVLMFDEECIKAVSKPSSNAIPTATSTSTPECPPLTNCYDRPPQLIIGPPPGSTPPAPTVTLPATSTQTPTLTPPVIITPTPRRDDRRLIPI